MQQRWTGRIEAVPKGKLYTGTAVGGALPVLRYKQLIGV